MGESSSPDNDLDPSEILNVNVGVLGHVDSGKTSLVKALSTLLSTAALDKSKQSRQRGMTLDLGFSCFFVDMPAHLKKHFPTKKRLQITLVDCPGHASLIRTIIGGAQIIDMVLLVVDAVKGWQVQTTECLVLAQLTSPHLLVALNKADLLEPSQREQKLQEAKKLVQKRLKATRFANAPIVGVAACVGGEKVAATTGGEPSESSKAAAAATAPSSSSAVASTATPAQTSSTNNNNSNLPDTYQMERLVALLKEKLPPPRRLSMQTTANSPFYFAIDHCFPIRGRGTVLTGTVLSGSTSVNDTIEFPALGAVQRKIKSMQMFKRQVPTITQGDRAGVCVSNLDAKLLERGIAATPGAVPLWKAALAVIRKVPYYTAGTIKAAAGSKFHVSVGHTTVMATLTCWGARELAAAAAAATNGSSSSSSSAAAAAASASSTGKDSDGGGGEAELTSSSLGGDADMAGLPKIDFDYNQDFLQQDELLESLDGNNQKNGSNDNNNNKNNNKSREPLLHWALLEFQTPVYCPVHSLVIGSRLDTTVDNATGSASSCRLAFSGRLIERVVDTETALDRVRLYTPKERRGVVSKLGDPHRRSDDDRVVRYEVFGSDLFKKETDMKPFFGLKLETEKGEIGEIKSSYGTSGKFRVFFPAGTFAREGDALILRFKRYARDPDKEMRQDIPLPAARPGTRIEVEKKKGKKKQQQPEEKGVNRVGEVASLKGDVMENGKHPMAIISGFFAPEINIKEKAGTTVLLPSTGDEGSIVGPFGKAGKCKVSFEKGTSAAVGAKAELKL